MSKPNSLEMPYCHWVLRVATSNMRTAEKLVTIVAPLLQTGDAETLALATGLAVSTVNDAKKRPVRDGWLWVRPVGHEELSKENKGGRGVKSRFVPSLPDSTLPVVVTDLDQVAVTATVSILHASGEKIHETVRENPTAPDTLSTENPTASRSLSALNPPASGRVSGQIPHTPYKESPTEITNTTPTYPTVTVEEVKKDSSSESGKRQRRLTYSAEFETFWQNYPNTTNNSKLKAFEEWGKLAPEDRALAVRALGSYAEFLRKNTDHPALHAERFIKHRRFDGFVETGKPGKPAWWANAEAVANLPPEQWVKGIDKFANGHWPVDKLGPVPGTPQCVVPQRIIAELRLTERYGTDGLERQTWKNRKDTDA